MKRRDIFAAAAALIVAVPGAAQAMPARKIPGDFVFEGKTIWKRITAEQLQELADIGVSIDRLHEVLSRLDETTETTMDLRSAYVEWREEGSVKGCWHCVVANCAEDGSGVIVNAVARAKV